MAKTDNVPDDRSDFDTPPHQTAGVGVGVDPDEIRPDVVSDPGVEGGVDAPNEEPEESEP